MTVSLSSGLRLTAGAVATAALLAVTPAAASAASSNGRVQIGGAPSASLPADAFPYGTSNGVTTAPNTPETVSFILKEQNVSQLESEVESGVSSYLSVSQFAAEYGQPAANVDALREYLAEHGIGTSVYPGNVDVVANGTAAQFNAALDVSQQNYHVPAVQGQNGAPGIPAQNVYAATSAPSLPATLAQYVTAILGLDNYTAAVSDIAHVPATLSRQASSSTGNASCTDTGSCTAANFAANYQLDPLYGDGADGQGETVGIITLAGYDPGAAGYYWTKVEGLPGTEASQNSRVSVDNIDGGPGAPSDAAGTGETDLDVEQAGGVAAGAHVIVYQAPNTDPGFIDAYFAAASSNVASSVSTSWGSADLAIEANIAGGYESTGYAAAFDEALLEMAVQGQSTFAPAGDNGAYDLFDYGFYNLSTDYPAASPYTTAAGGTTLPWSGTVTGPDGTVNAADTQQRAWAWDYLWPAFASTTGVSTADAAESSMIGGGGGYSALETATPSYQSGISGLDHYTTVPYFTPNTPTNVGGGFDLDAGVSVNLTPRDGSGTGSGRAVPDVSADADPFSGYALYEPSALTAATPAPALQDGWGGTSFVGPQLNGSTAVIDSLVGRRVGFWNSSIYKFAESANSPFTPLDTPGASDDNLYYSGSVGTLYNPATGLGVPNLAKLAVDFANQG